MFGLSKREKCIRATLTEVANDINAVCIIRPSIIQVAFVLQSRLDSQDISITQDQACKYVSKHESHVKKS